MEQNNSHQINLGSNNIQKLFLKAQFVHRLQADVLQLTWPYSTVTKQATR